MAIRRILFRLWSLYFHSQELEGDGRVYERLGIRKVGRFMIGGYYSLAAIRLLSGRKHRRLRGRRSAYEWLIFTFVAELAHEIFFVVMLVVTASHAAAGRWKSAAIAAALNLVINVIPVMVQRYNRARIVTALKVDPAEVLDSRFWDGRLSEAGKESSSRGVYPEPRRRAQGDTDR